VIQPKWSIGQQTSYELRDQRANLETAIAGLTAGSPDYAGLKNKLNAVLDEQAARKSRRIPAGVLDDDSWA
jgi:hypothetical protein